MLQEYEHLLIFKKAICYISIVLFSFILSFYHLFLYIGSFVDKIYMLPVQGKRLALSFSLYSLFGPLFTVMLKLLGVLFQAAILYTSVSGQRRLRCINMAFNVCTQLADMFRNCELDVLTNFMAKQGEDETNIFAKLFGI